jgi:2-methylcitrate dehydratase PrpD
MSLTRYVAEFIEAPGAIPADVQALGRKSILDGLGLAVAGAAAESGHIVNAYLADLGFAGGDSTVLGTRLRLPARFAAFANGVAVHAHDYDDTQLAVATDRVYGLLMHPTAAELPAVLAVAEREGSSRAWETSSSSSAPANLGAVQTEQRPQGCGSGSSSSSCRAIIRHRPSWPSAAIAACSERRRRVTCS